MLGMLLVSCVMGRGREVAVTRRWHSKGRMRMRVFEAGKRREGSVQFHSPLLSLMVDEV